MIFLWLTYRWWICAYIHECRLRADVGALRRASVRLAVTDSHVSLLSVVDEVSGAVVRSAQQ